MAVVDTVLIGAVCAIAVLILTTRHIRLLNPILTVFYRVVMVTAVHMKGDSLLGWAYPTIAASFFLVNPLTALALSAGALLAILPVILDSGTLINAGTIVVTLLLTTLFVYVFAAQTRQQRTSLHEQARRDPLTDTGNRRALEDTLTRLIELNRSGASTASVILLDIDHFKRINDEHGHDLGDQVLVELVDVLAQRVRRTDALFRLGGEEFVVVANGADAERAKQLAEALRRRVEQACFSGVREGLTVSLGVAEIRADDQPGGWLRRADEALYGAKGGGRNAVRIESLPGSVARG